ncbi:Copine family protein [Trichomonas vaginalis G3]|uniref:Copine family protein n=1 Tax=Trichomonas vaginalis (strain ATCC PRA-98 / G3) TaxID=412133 RepID=A2F8P2_TRIV3|nr:copine family [Trichomonas vaginalis G3]EAX98720.1 Copine family protein [Trichomonas vaginalis G3]KAI5538498.1 copine family [Trichomonas vaginalis G3]|eukprot:XP_001311650.1 Copine family protein [Trichomonas vaginalis G3]
MNSIVYGSHYQQKRGNLNSAQGAIANVCTTDVVNESPIVDIHLSAKNLPKLDIGSQSDPLCVVFIPINGQWVEAARTEVIWDNPNPSWVKIIKTYYIFETNQPLRFCVYDADSEKADLSKHDFVGQCETTVQQIVSNFGHDITLDLHDSHHNSKRGQLVITGEQAANCTAVATFQLAVRNLKKMHTFSRNNPYIILSKGSESGRLLPSYKSEYCRKCASCTFRQADVSLQSLCNGDQEVPITVSVFNFRSGKVDELIGSFSASLNRLMENQGQEFELKDTKNKSVGFFKFVTLQIGHRPTFLDYIRSGLQLNLITAIDYTASNGDPRTPNSLHYINPSMPNQYETCIWSVGSIVCPYDSDQQFPVFGFGCKINGTVNHCFPVTFNPQNPNVPSLQDIVGAYRHSLTQVQLSGPTLFAPIITSATQVAQASFAESRTYTILMIITDGIINDMRETIDAIVAASDAPLSIIIIGVGTADFGAMDVLDADDVPLRSSSGVVMKRDIVQFVPFRQFGAQGGPALAAAVLEEVPRQVDQFCRAHGFVPQLKQ